jgi:hypothetical protein
MFRSKWKLGTWYSEPTTSLIDNAADAVIGPNYAALRERHGSSGDRIPNFSRVNPDSTWFKR